MTSVGNWRSARGAGRLRKVGAGLLALLVLASVGAQRAWAADVTYVVNLEAPKLAIVAGEDATYTMTVVNRSTADPTAPVALRFRAPNSVETDWSAGVTCTATGDAVCPASWAWDSASSHEITATADPIPAAGSLKFKVTVPGAADYKLAGQSARIAQISASATAGTGDTELSPDTSSAVQTITVKEAVVGYSYQVTGPATATAGSTVTYQVVLANTGEVPNSFFADTQLAETHATGELTAMTCVGAGGADCAKLVAFDAGDQEPSGSALFTPGKRSTVGMANMPAGGSVTLTYTATIDQRCDAGANTSGSVRVAGEVKDSHVGGIIENNHTDADNSDDVTTGLAINCTSGNLAVTATTQPGTQLSPGVNVGAAYSFASVYENLGTAPATDVSIDVKLWAVDGGTGGLRLPDTTLSGSPTCTPANGAVCPSSWSAPALEGTSTLTMTGTGASIPAGGKLTITYSGTGPNAPTPGNCSPGTLEYTTLISSELAETSAADNGSLEMLTTSDPGRGVWNLAARTNTNLTGCPSFDIAVDQKVYTDAAMTQVLTGPVAPGTKLYLRHDITNIAHGPGAQADITYSQVKWKDPQIAKPLPRYNGKIVIGTALYDATGGLPSRHPAILDQDTGISCTSTGGNESACPSGLYGGVSPLEDRGLGDPTLHPGQTVTYTRSVTMPVLYDGATCLSAYYGGGQTISFPWSMEVTGTTTDPRGLSESTYANNSTSGNIQVLLPQCNGTDLRITKTTPLTELPANRKVPFEIVVAAEGSTALDLPHLVDTPVNGAPATITCTGATGGAACPTSVRLADGSEVPLGAAGITGSPLDLTWGKAGEATMPVGSTVTFQVVVQFPDFLTYYARNSASFTAAAGSTNAQDWPLVTDFAEISGSSGLPLAISKNVNPALPKPGELVTFTLNLLNVGGSDLPAYFSDTMSDVLVATNPTGFSTPTCRAITAADGLLDASRAVGSTSCPTFDSTPSGLTAEIPSFAANSGLQLTYTAVAPEHIGQVPNTAYLWNSVTQATLGDAIGKANLAVIKVSVAGTIWDDANGSAKGGFKNIDSPGENATNAGGLTALLIDPKTGLVIAVTPVNPDGTYLFTNVDPETDVTVQITASAAAPGVGEKAGKPVLPTGWLATSPLVQVTFNTGSRPVKHKDFGIQQPPVAQDKEKPRVKNPGPVHVQVPTLAGTDPEDGALGKGTIVTIETLPDPKTGVLYYDGKPVKAGQVISSYDPSKLTFVPAPGTVDPFFTYTVTDAAGEVSPPATVRLAFYVEAEPRDTKPEEKKTDPPKSKEGELAVTGANVDGSVALGAALLAAGGALVILVRRRRGVN